MANLPSAPAASTAAGPLSQRAGRLLSGKHNPCTAFAFSEMLGMAHNELQVDDDDLGLERELFNYDDDDFDLFRAAAVISRVGGEEPDFDAISEEIDRLAARVMDANADNEPWPRPLQGLIATLFEREGFRGDAETYDDPANSFLPAVLRRRMGLPISLGVLTCEVARRAGIEAYGIAFPGHFLVGVQGAAAGKAAELVVIDPFHAGVVLSPIALAAQLSQLMGRPVELQPEHLMPAAPRTILLRMLVNLRGSYARRNDPVGMFRVLSRVLLLSSDNPEALAERALVRRDLLDHEGAERDARRALAAARDLDAPAALRAQHVLAQLEADRRWAH